MRRVFLTTSLPCLYTTRLLFHSQQSSTEYPLSLSLLDEMANPDLTENGVLDSSALIFLGTGCSSAVPNARCLIQPSDPPCEVCFQSLSVPPDRNPNYRYYYYYFEDVLSLLFVPHCCNLDLALCIPGLFCLVACYRSLEFNAIVVCLVVESSGWLIFLVRAQVFKFFEFFYFNFYDVLNVSKKEPFGLAFSYVE